MFLKTTDYILVRVTSHFFLCITLQGRRSTTDDLTITCFQLVLSSAVLVELAKFIPVQSWILSSHLFFCLPLLFPFTVPCRIAFTKSEDPETWPNHLRFGFLTMVRSSSYSPMNCCLDLSANLPISYEMFINLR